jgi:hypothetical protein
MISDAMGGSIEHNAARSPTRRDVTINRPPAESSGLLTLASTAARKKTAPRARWYLPAQTYRAAGNAVSSLDL